MTVYGYARVSAIDQDLGPQRRITERSLRRHDRGRKRKRRATTTAGPNCRSCSTSSGRDTRVVSRVERHRFLPHMTPSAACIAPGVRGACGSRSFAHVTQFTKGAAASGVLVTSVLAGMADSAAADLARAEGLLDRALAASPGLAFAHFEKGHVLRAQNRWEEAMLEYEAALALDHNSVYALNGLGWCKLYAGSIEEVIPLMEQAIRLSPRDPWIGHLYYLIGTVYLLQSHTDEAIVWLEKARSHAYPTDPSESPRFRL